MTVPSTMADLSVSSSGNSPDGSVDPPSALDDNIRAVAAIVRRTQARGAAIASASTVNLGATTDGEFVHITGTATISSFGTVAAGVERTLVFDGALTLTHSSNLLCPYLTSFTTTAGDVMTWRSEGSGVWKCVSHLPAASSSERDRLGLAIGTDVHAHMASASQAEMEAGAEAGLRAMSPLRVAQAIAALGSVRYSPVRQTVLMGSVDSSGLPSFLPSTSASLSITSQNVTSSAPLVVTAANGGDDVGVVDRIGATTANITWASLPASATSYLYVDVASDGTLSTGHTTLPPVYQVGGSRSTTNGQATFNTSEMSMTVGNGSSAVQTYRVFVGEATTGGSTVTATVAYAYCGRFVGSWVSSLPGLSTNFQASANLGISEDVEAHVEIQCTTADSGYAVGDVLVDPATNYGSYVHPLRIWRSRNSVGSITGTSVTAFAVPHKTSGTSSGLTSGSWKYRFVAERGW